MSFESKGAEGLDYQSCRYGASRLLFRGPAKPLDKPYVAFIGSDEVFGRFAEHTIPDMVEQATGTACVNLGNPNAGIDAFLHDATVLEICRNAQLTVLQVLGAQNMSNRMYTVHPRRNDRFVAASGYLKTLYRSTDFTQIHYTRHLLSTLRAESEERYLMVSEELSAAWVARMKTLLENIGKPVCLLWLADRAPANIAECDPFGHDPLFVSEPMLKEVSDLINARVTVVATREEVSAGKERMVLGQMDQPVADEMLGPVVLERAARSLETVVGNFCK